MEVLCIGESRVDTVMFTDGFIKENTKNTIKEKIVSPGGCALTSSILLSKWGHITYLSSIVGNDDKSKLITDTLDNSEVNSEYLIKTDKETTSSYIVVNRYNASRTVLNTITKEENEKVDLNINPDIILMDGTNYNVATLACNKYKDKIKVLSASVVSEETTKLCKLSDYIICDKAFAEILARERINYDKPDTLKSVLNKLENMYKSKVIITLGEKGSLYKVDDKIKVMGAIKVKEIDKSGVGDIYFGAFVYGLAENLSLEKCLKIATIAAGLSVKKVGEVFSIPDVREVHNIYGKNK